SARSQRRRIAAPTRCPEPSSALPSARTQGRRIASPARGVRGRLRGVVSRRSRSRAWCRRALAPPARRAAWAPPAGPPRRAPPPPAPASATTEAAAEWPRPGQDPATAAEALRASAARLEAAEVRDLDTRRLRVTSTAEQVEAMRDALTAATIQESFVNT